MPAELTAKTYLKKAHDEWVRRHAELDETPPMPLWIDGKKADLLEIHSDFILVRYGRRIMVNFDRFNTIELPD